MFGVPTSHPRKPSVSKAAPAAEADLPFCSASTRQTPGRAPPLHAGWTAHSPGAPLLPCRNAVLLMLPDHTSLFLATLHAELTTGSPLHTPATCSEHAPGICVVSFGAPGTGLDSYPYYILSHWICPFNLDCQGVCARSLFSNVFTVLPKIRSPKIWQAVVLSSSA